MRGCLTSLIVLCVFVYLSIILPSQLIGFGLEDFEGQERLASHALLDVTSYYGNGSLEIGDYNGPPLVPGWHTKGVEECSAPPPGKRIEKDSLRAYIGGRATVGAYTLFGIPLGEIHLARGDQRRWEPYF